MKRMVLRRARNMLQFGHPLLWFAVASWFLLMWPLFTAGPLVLDEHGSYWILDSDLPGTSLKRSLDYAAIPPLSSWLQQASLGALGKSEFAFRFPSALCALLAIGMCYQAGKELGDPKAGGIAALVAAWHPEAMNEVRIARCYGLVYLLGAVLLWMTLRWQRSPQSFRWAICWCLSAAALLWTHYAAGLLVAVSGLWVAGSVLWRRDPGRGGFLPLIVAAVGLAVLCLPLMPAVVRLKEWGPFLNYSQSGASVWNVIGPFWWAAIPVGVIWNWLAGRGETGPHSQRGTLWFTAACSLLPLAGIAVLSSGELSSLANPRYRVAFAPAGACFVALLLSSTRSWRASVFGAAAVLIIAWSFSPAVPWQAGRLGSAADQDWWELNSHLSEASKADEPILVQSGLAEAHLVPIFAEDELFMEYVACRVSRFYVESRHPRLGLPFLWDPQTGISHFYGRALDSWRDVPGTFWVACATDTDLNRNSLAGIQQVAESSGFEAIETRTWPNATLIHYRFRGESAD